MIHEPLSKGFYKMTVTRFAPSPTGFIHVGNLRTALINYLISKKTGGRFILRLDDTDPVRSKPEYADQIKRDLEWLGLFWDSVETQSSRLDRYVEVASNLKKNGKLYEAFETSSELELKRKKQLNMGLPPAYDRSALKYTSDQILKLRIDHPGYWRFFLEHNRIDWDDGILGKISIDAGSLSDPVLIRGDGQFLYTLASVVDDTDMGITHVVRGSDHVTNTATQVQIIQALRKSVPSFAHHSLLTGAKKEALSKRMGGLAIKDLKKAGVEPMVLLSQMARLGTSDPVELRTSVDELVKHFELYRFGSSPTKFDTKELYALNTKYMRLTSLGNISETLSELQVPDNMKEAFWDIAKDNISTRSDLEKWWKLCSEGAEPVIEQIDSEFVKVAISLLPKQPYDQETWTNWTKDVKDKTGRSGRDLFMPLRKALTGLEHGPDMSKLLPLLKVIK